MSVRSIHERKSGCGGLGRTELTQAPLDMEEIQGPWEDCCSSVETSCCVEGPVEVLIEVLRMVLCSW